MLRPRLCPTIAAAGLAIGWAVLAGADATASIFDTDDRMSVGHIDGSLKSVGVVSETATSNYGTAFLIDACHALTARHVIHHADAIGQRVSLWFEPWRPATRFNSAAGIVVAAGGAASNGSDLSQDWALLRVDPCLGETLGFLRPSSEPLALRPGRPGIAPKLMAVGFPHDRRIEDGPTIDPDCQVRLMTSFGLLHDCATLPGNSGGPLIAWNADRRRHEVYAINVAGFDKSMLDRFDPDVANIAVSLHSILPVIRTQIERDRRSDASVRP